MTVMALITFLSGDQIETQIEHGDFADVVTALGRSASGGERAFVRIGSAVVRASRVESVALIGPDTAQREWCDVSSRLEKTGE